MAWSIVNYDTLHLLYVAKDGEQYLLRKSLTSFRILYTDAIFVEMIVDTNAYAWNPLPNGGPLFGVTNTRSAGMVYSWTQSLFYEEASTPSAASAQDLLLILNGYLLTPDIKVQRNNVFIGEQSTLNFIEGPNITITAVNDSVNGRVNVTIGGAALGGEDPFPKILMMMGG